MSEENTNQGQEQEQQNTGEGQEQESKGLLSGVEDPVSEYKEVLGDDFDEEKVSNLLNKYKTEEGNLDDKQLVKALYNANKMIGQKQNQAPEKYEFEKSENLKDFDFNEEQLESFNEIAKEIGLSNEQYNKLVNSFGETVNNELNNATEQLQQHQEEIIKSIDNFDDRALSLKRTLSGALSEDEFNTVANSIESKEQFEAWEKIVSKIKNSQIPTDNTPANDTTIDDKIQDLTAQISKETSNTKKEQLVKQRRELIIQRINYSKK